MKYLIIVLLLYGCATVDDKHKPQCIEIGGKWIDNEGCNLDD